MQTDTFTIEIPPHRKLSKLQEDILRQVAKGDKNSKSTLMNRLDKDYPNISESVDILIKKKFLQVIYCVDGKRGKDEKILGLTDEGILKLMDLGITNEDFWDMLFFIYDTETKHELKLTIDQVFTEYESKVLHASSEYIPFLTSSMTDGIIAYKFPKITIGSPAYRILEVLIYNGPSTLQQIFESLKISKNEHEKYLAAIGQRGGSSDSNTGMMGNALIDVDRSTIPVYRATLFSVILELGDLWQLIGNKNQQDNIKNKMRLIIERNQNLLPLVFGKWTKLKRVYKEEEELLNAFVSWFSKTSGFSYPILEGGFQELFELQYCWGTTMSFRYSGEPSYGDDAHERWLKKRGMLEVKDHKAENKEYIPKESADSTSVATVIEKINQIRYLQTSEEYVDLLGLDEHSTSENAFANTLSFRFYTTLLSDEWDGKNGVKLISIFEKDIELKKWYHDWFHEFNAYLKEILGKTEKIEEALRV